MGLPVDIFFPGAMQQTDYDSGTVAPNNKPVDAARSLLPSDVNSLSADYVQEKLNAIVDVLTGDKKLPITAGEPETLESAGRFFIYNTGTAFELRFKWPPNGDVTVLHTFPIATPPIFIPYKDEPATPVGGCVMYLVDTGTAYTVRIKWPNGDVEDVSTHDYV